MFLSPRAFRCCALQNGFAMIVIAAVVLVDGEVEEEEMGARVRGGRKWGRLTCFGGRPRAAFSGERERDRSAQDAGRFALLESRVYRV